MKRILSSRLFLLLLAVAGGLSASGQSATNSNKVFPLITMENTPLNDAIRMLARPEGMNLILDPNLPGSTFATDVMQPNITKRWVNTTARKALEEMLAEQKLVLVENPATTVTRITYADRGAKPVAASQVIGDTNQVALIMMDDVPMEEALNQIARRAALKVEIDPAVSQRKTASNISFDRGVSFRWENLSPAQALAALVDAYDLEMVKTEAGDKYRILPKTKPEAKPGSSEKAKPTAK